MQVVPVSRWRPRRSGWGRVLLRRRLRIRIDRSWRGRDLLPWIRRLMAVIRVWIRGVVVHRSTNRFAGDCRGRGRRIFPRAGGLAVQRRCAICREDDDRRRSRVCRDRLPRSRVGVHGDGGGSHCAGVGRSCAARARGGAGWVPPTSRSANSCSPGTRCSQDRLIGTATYTAGRRGSSPMSSATPVAHPRRPAAIMRHPISRLDPQASSQFAGFSVLH